MSKSVGALIVQIVRFLIELLPTRKTLASPTSTEAITYSQLHELLSDEFPEADIFLSDKLYRLCNLHDIERFLEQDKTNKHGYVGDIYDCDDFSYRLMGQFSIRGWSDLCLGIVWTYYHALNCVVAENGRVYFIEPQTDELLEPTDDVRLIII